MLALFIESPGNPPSLVVRDVPIPTLGDSDVLVKVAACGFCHHDAAVMEGTLRRGVSYDITPGHEISGNVAKVGSQVKTLAEGGQVVATLTTFCGTCERCLAGDDYRCLNAHGIGHGIQGGFAEYIALPESSLIHVPPEIDIIEAALLACPIAVSIKALDDMAQLKPGETVVVLGAGGGLGVHSVQVAASMGARVIAVTTSPEKLEALESFDGVDVLLADEFDFSEIVAALTEDIGADVVVNTVGANVMESGLRSLSQFGRMVALGEVGRSKTSFNLAELLFRNASVIGSTGANRSNIEHAVKLVSDKKIRPVVSRRFELEQAVDAFNLIEAKGLLGRAVIVP